ncbi:hypothetical protein ZTR_04625 [Talaromyces verruculosus]|nr:hypothetical protein ZTR_04625 [Talaromyces verruculosus]
MRRDSQTADKVSRACDNLKKRGPPKGYVNTLEQRLASLESLVAELREGQAEADPVPSDNTTLGSSAINTNYNNKRGLEVDENADDIKPQQRQIALPGKSHTRKSDGNSERSAVLGYLSVDENMTMRYHGPTSGLHLMTASRVFVSPFWHFSNPGFWPRSKRTTFRTEDEIVSAADAILGGILPPIPLQNKLLDAYWTFAHPCFPVVHRETFLFQLSKDRRGMPRQGRSAFDQLERRIPQVLLLSMFALSARFVDNGESREDSDPGDEYAIKAETLLAQHKQSSINCCLALIMMAYREIGTGGSISWMYVGKAIRMAQDLGLHRDPSVWKKTQCFRNMSNIEMQIRRLIWWGAFVLDRYISAWQGRPCAIHEDDFDTQLPEDTLHENRDHSLSCFIQVVKLSILQGRIHKAFYSVGVKEPNWTTFNELENDLDEWEGGVPDFLAIKQGVKLLVPVIVMHTQFWNCKVLLHRPFIVTSPNETQSNNPSLLAATSAAVAIANLLEHFTSSYSPTFAPPFFNYYCFTAIIMHLFNRATYPVLFSPSALMHCIDCCRKMKSIWSSAARTLHIIEGVDHEVENTMPDYYNVYASATAPTAAATAMMDAEQQQGAVETDEPAVLGFSLSSWPSPIVEPDWLSLETWRS